MSTVTLLSTYANRKETIRQLAPRLTCFQSTPRQLARRTSTRLWMPKWEKICLSCQMYSLSSFMTCESDTSGARFCVWMVFAFGMTNFFTSASSSSPVVHCVVGATQEYGE